MGDIRPVEPVKLICGIIAADAGMAGRARTELERLYGRIDVEAGPFPFDKTDYYATEMGSNLQRWFVAFEAMVDPGRLADIKRETNAIEEQLSVTEGGTFRRRVNLDPGYATPAKLVLATTKDFAHRVYLEQGIYAEVTLNFKKSGGMYFPWTYPDFKDGRYDEFLFKVRRSVLPRGKKSAAAHEG